MSETEVMQELGGAVLLTPEGYKRLQEELEFLTSVKRPEIADRIRESQQHGEFSEDNTELDEVKFEQAMVENRIGELKNLFSNAQMLEDAQISDEHVAVGTYVTIADQQFDDEFEVRIVSSIEADPTKDLISNESPMGTALFGHRKGDEVSFSAPEGRKHYKIIGLRK
jgi:transcription elongation factor GreA